MAFTPDGLLRFLTTFRFGGPRSRLCWSCANEPNVFDVNDYALASLLYLPR
jgi:hypothetical protein